MATTVAGGTPTCVSWLLVASYAVLLGGGGLGVWVSVINFGQEEALPPTPPPENTTITTTTTTPAPGGRQYYYRDRNQEEVPQAYKDYVSQSIDFANISNDTRFYLAPLCLVCVVVASSTLVAGLFSRRLFNSTFSLYSSLGLWILTLVMTFMYQFSLVWIKFPVNQHMVGWVLGCHIMLLLFLPVQMLLCMWELRRQKTEGWPTINFLNVFTVEALLLVSRLCLSVYAFEALSESQIFRGFEGKQDPRYKEQYYPYSRIKYPLEFSLLCHAAASYNAVATLETTLSMLLGKLHHRMTTLTCLLSGFCCVTVAVLSSPAFVRVFIGPHVIYPMTMTLAISLSVVSFLHWLACLFIPSTLRTPAHIVTYITDRLLQAISLGDIVAILKTQGMKKVDLLPKTMKHDFHIKAASLIFSIISIVIIGTSMTYMPAYRIWGHIMVLCANSVTVMRTLPILTMKRSLREKESIPLKQRLIGLALETPTLFVGGIALCANSYDGLGIFGGVANIFFAVFQGFVMWCLFKEKLSQDQHSEDTKHLTLAEEVTSEEDNQNNTPDEGALAV